MITLDEMTRYLTAIFKVVYHAEPGTAEQMACSPEELAMATAEDAFEEADLNNDGQLTFEEFQKWSSAGQETQQNVERLVQEVPSQIPLTQTSGIPLACSISRPWKCCRSLPPR